jgi:predicted ArsR family transcriptional regulator
MRNWRSKPKTLTRAAQRKPIERIEIHDSLPTLSKVKYLLITLKVYELTMATLQHLPKSQAALTNYLKSRGAQSIKILAAALELTTMGVRQHLSQLEAQGYVQQAQRNRQTRGRPVTLWKLSRQGHELFADRHAQLAVTLLQETSKTFGDGALNSLIQSDSQSTLARYRALLPAAASDLEKTLEGLCEQRTIEGFMAELRFTPSGWLLIENHCPLYAAASQCRALCDTELALFRALLEPHAQVQRADHVLAGARRCAYKITPAAVATGN